MGQGDYKNVSKKQLINALIRLSRISTLDIEKSTNHTWKLESPGVVRPYPIPIGHPEIKSWVVSGIVKWLVANEVCTQKDFEKLLQK